MGVAATLPEFREWTLPIPDICAFDCPLSMCTRLSFQIRETIKPVHYCKITDKAKKVREGNLICPDNDFTIEAI